MPPHFSMVRFSSVLATLFSLITDTFYTNAVIIAAYKKYISAFVGRYVNEPTIMAWELANEPRCAGSSGSPSAACNSTMLTTWAAEISAYIKSIDSNHLVAIGGARRILASHLSQIR